MNCDPGAVMMSLSPLSIWVQSGVLMGVTKPSLGPLSKIQRVLPSLGASDVAEGIFIQTFKWYLVAPVGSMGTHCRNELMASSSPPPCSWRLRLPEWCSSVVALSLPRHPPTAQGG